MNRKIYLMAAVLLATLLFLLPGAGSAAPALIGSIADSVDRPTGVAVDSQGNIYTSETTNDRVHVYDRKGRLIKHIPVPRPLGVAVAASGYIYVGSITRKAVDIYAPDHTYVRSLGAGVGEIGWPSSIAVDGAGKVYVLDGSKAKVCVYDPATAQLLFSFGGSGNTDGLFNKPTAVAVSDATDEIFVADLRKTLVTSGAIIDGAKIQVFDKTGGFKRSFGEYGIEAGKIGKPTGLAFDGSGNIFILDIIQGAALSFDAAAGTFNNIALYKPAVSTKPLGIAIGKNKIAYITEDSSRSISVYGLDGYTTMDVTPAALAFASKQLSANADAKMVTISNAGNGSLGWTASADSAWITLDAASGTTGPASSGSLAVGTNNTDLMAGTYQGVVTITSDFGQIDSVPVTFTVTPAATIGFSNGTVAFDTKSGKTPAAQPITIDVQNAESLPWSASSDSSWLAISPAEGTTTTTAALSINMAGVMPGTYTGHITLSAPTAIGDGGKMTVALTVTAGTKIRVTSNIPQASFTVTGADASYTGSGEAWSVENVPQGEYTVTFAAVSGYRKPLPETKNLTGEEIVLSGNYLSHADIAGRTNIIVGKGAHPNNDSLIRIYKNDGAPAAEMMAFGQESRSGTNTASADIDGDGVAELIAESGAADKTSVVRALKADGTTLVEFAPFTTPGRANVAAGDLNGDGRAEIVVAPAANDMNAPVSLMLHVLADGGNDRIRLNDEVRASLLHRTAAA
jgi:sugar lactone lactonase YvrE